MKRVILGLLATASVAVLFVILLGVFDLDGPTRLLVFAGAGVVLATAIDGLRVSLSKADPAADSAVPPMPAAPTITPPAATTQPTAAPAVPPLPPQPASAELVIDLRDSARPLEGTGVVDELIAAGELSRTNGPISDDDVPRIVMAALVT